MRESIIDYQIQYNAEKECFLVQSSSGFFQIFFPTRYRLATSCLLLLRSHSCSSSSYRLAPVFSQAEAAIATTTTTSTTQLLLLINQTWEILERSVYSSSSYNMAGRGEGAAYTCTGACICSLCSTRALGSYTIYQGRREGLSYNEGSSSKLAGCLTAK